MKGKNEGWATVMTLPSYALGLLSTNLNPLLCQIMTAKLGSDLIKDVFGEIMEASL